MFLKQSVAVTVVLGPFVDATDGVTAESGLTIGQADVRLSKNGGSFAQKNNATGCTHLENGYYDCPLSATDTGTLGHLRLAVAEAGALPVWRDFLVVPAEVYDALVAGSDNLTADLTAAALGSINSQVDTALADVELDHFPDLVEDDGGSYRLTEHALEEAPGGGGSDPWATALPGSYTAGQAGWIVGNRLDAAVSSVSGNNPGAGAVEFTYTLTEAGSGDPIADADVWASTDVAGSNVVASGRTDQNGQITFYLDSGTVYLWRQKSGYNFTNPDVEVIA
jgi:hypothetical protein